MTQKTGMRPTQLNLSPHLIGGFEDLTISGNGHYVAFTASINVTGENPDFSSELFLLTLSDNSIEQITNTLGQHVSHPSIDDTGNRIAFFSQGDLTGENPDGSSEAFLFEDGKGIIQITNYPSVETFVLDTSITSNGNQVIFTVQNFPDFDNSYNIFDTRTQQTNLLPNTPDFNIPSLSIFNDNGNRHAFISNENPFGTNPDSSPELFVFDFINQATQITTTLNRFVSSPTINNNGNRIAFISNGDLTGENPDGSEEIFLAELQPVNNLRNVSYNGQIPPTGVKLGFIVEQATTVAITAESFANNQNTELPNPALALTTLNGAPLAKNNTCDDVLISIIGRETTSPDDACIVLKLQPDLYVVEAKDMENQSGNALVSITAALQSPATLRNLSYNGPTPEEGIKLGFITESEAEYIVTAESIDGEQIALPNAQLNLSTLNGNLISENDDCPAEDSQTHLNRLLATPQDACVVNLLPAGAYISEVDDTGQHSGNALLSITRSLAQ